MLNMNLNALLQLSDEQRQEVITFLDDWHADQIQRFKTTRIDPNEELLMGIEYVLEALGADGYQFT